jgi:hypothetical protein
VFIRKIKILVVSLMGLGSWKPLNTIEELELVRAGEEPLDMEAEDATLLNATTKQCSKDCDG